MQICFVSTYPPRRCGIGTYTASLARALAEDGQAPPGILAERGALDGTDGAVLSMPTYRRNQDYVEAIVAGATQAQAELVHVQHSPDTLGMDARLPRLLTELRAKRIRSVVTLHTVHSRRSGALERWFHVARFHRRLAEAADALVVHGDHMMVNELVQQGVPAAKILTIAHGTRVIPSVERTEARRRLGQPVDRPLLLYFGFIHPQKNVHTILLAFARLRQVVPDCRLYVAGSVQNPIWTNRMYLKALRSIIRARGLTDSVVFREEFVPAEEAPVLYGAADLVLLPYAQSYGSASGVVHQTAGAGVVPLCSRSPKFYEIGAAIDESLLVSTHSPKAWAEAIASLLGDPERRAMLTERVRRFADETSWPRVAERHRALYASLGVSGGGTEVGAMNP